MKAYTDIEQSKKLAKILPIESADMSINHSLFHNKTTVLTTPYKKLHDFFNGDTPDTTFPCWSLAALIELIPDECRMEKTPLDQTGEFTYSFIDDYYNIRTYEEDNPVDACYEMLLKFYELNLL